MLDLPSKHTPPTTVMPIAPDPASDPAPEAMDETGFGKDMLARVSARPIAARMVSDAYH
jgi:hypothetical protein